MEWTIACYECYIIKGLIAEKSLSNQTLAYPFEVNPIWSYWTLKGPTLFTSFLYPASVLNIKWRISGKGTC